MPELDPELELPPDPIEEAPVLPVVPDALELPLGSVDEEAPVLPEVPLALELSPECPVGALDELCEPPDDPRPELLDEPEEPEVPVELEAPRPELLDEPELLSAGAVEDALPEP